MLDAYRDLIDDLVSTPSEVQALVPVAAGDPEGVTALRALHAREVAIHDRMLLMLKRQGAVLPPLAESGDDPAEDAAAALAGFETARGEVVSLLMNLTLKDWERSAIGEDGYEVTIADEVEAHIEHQEEQVARLRGAGR